MNLPSLVISLLVLALLAGVLFPVLLFSVFEASSRTLPSSQLAWVAYREGDFAAAKRFASSCRSGDYDELRAHQCLASIHIEEKSYAEALKAINKGLEILRRLLRTRSFDVQILLTEQISFLAKHAQILQAENRNLAALQRLLSALELSRQVQPSAKFSSDVIAPIYRNLSELYDYAASEFEQDERPEIALTYRQQAQVYACAADEIGLHSLEENALGFAEPDQTVLSRLERLYQRKDEPQHDR